MSSRAHVPLPSGYTIRPYRDEDYQDARKLFGEGMGSLYWRVFKTSLRTIRMLLILIISFSVPCLAFSSFTAGAISVSSLLLISSWSAWKTLTGKKRTSRPLYRQPVWAEPQADSSQIHPAHLRIVARDNPPISRSFLAYDAMFVVLDER